MLLKKIIFLFLFFISGLFLNIIYRPYIYKNELNDFGLADTGYSIFAVTIVSLILWLFKSSLTNNKILDIIILTLAYICFEISSYYFEALGFFDIKDIIALIVSGLLTIIILYCLDKEGFIVAKNLLLKKKKLSN